MIDKLEAASMLVEAHTTPDPQSGNREPIYMFKHLGGHSFSHHALKSVEFDADEALLEEMSFEGLLDIDYRDSTLSIVLTKRARDLIDAVGRVNAESPLADIKPIAAALLAQSREPDRFAWPAVVPVLEALRKYWNSSQDQPEGIAIPPILNALEEEVRQPLVVTLRLLCDADYLVSVSDLKVESIPAELAFTEKALQTLNGWPGGTNEQRADNLLVVVQSIARDEGDPVKKKRLEQFGEAAKEVGSATLAELLARVAVGSI